MQALHSLAPCFLYSTSPDSVSPPSYSLQGSFLLFLFFLCDVLAIAFAYLFVPSINRDHFRISGKDPGYEDSLNFLISISTAVGEHCQFIILVRRFQNSRKHDTTRSNSTQNQVVDALRPENDLQIAPAERAGSYLGHDHLPRLRSAGLMNIHLC